MNQLKPNCHRKLSLTFMTYPWQSLNNISSCLSSRESTGRHYPGVAEPRSLFNVSTVVVEVARCITSETCGSAGGSLRGDVNCHHSCIFKAKCQFNPQPSAIEVFFLHRVGSSPIVELSNAHTRQNLVLRAAHSPTARTAAVVRLSCGSRSRAETASLFHRFAAAFATPRL